MKYEVIGSSSKGNCIVVEDMLMLDCGVSYSRIKPYLKKVKLIFISHCHKDHLLPSTIQKIAYNHPTIKFICGSREVVHKLTNNDVLYKNIFFVESKKWFCLGILDFRLEPLIHDAENYALKFKINTVDKKGIYIVDTATVDGIEAKGLDENYNLIVDRTPKMNFLAKSTPELILKRIYEKSDDELKVVYARILEKF